MTERHEIWKFVDGIQMDLRAAQGKMISLRSYLAGLNIPEQEQLVCPKCGVPLKGERTLAEHVYHSHDGPMPSHWDTARLGCAETVEKLVGGLAWCELPLDHDGEHQAKNPDGSKMTWVIAEVTA